MEKVKIKLPAPSRKHEYTIFIGNGLIEQIASLLDLKKYSRLFVITDTEVEPLYLKKAVYFLPQNTSHVVVPSGEKQKNIDNVQRIWKAMLDAGVDRKSLVINLGGGVIGDMGGFAASTYMRGIRFINIPTTLLSQVDESVGGKTMVNFYEIKNIVGTFYQPSAVIIDVETLKTLPKKQFLSGFAEIIKHGLIKDKNYFDLVTSEDPFNFTPNQLIQIIKGSCIIKASFVQKDETEETGLRKIVNFGHTIGHAIEALSLETEKPLSHGEAISIGMIAEAVISNNLGMLPVLEGQRIERALEKAGLPTKYEGLSVDAIMKKMTFDKKNSHGKINFTLLKGIGRAVYNQNVPDETIINSIKKVIT